jgi:hypothetical protein
MTEYILCAAIWYKEIKLVREIPEVRPKNIDRGIVVLGHRHGQVIWTVASLTGLRTVTFAEDAVGEHEQGFLTSTNRFVDRKEAYKIAALAGQIKNIDYSNPDLYSEDLY